MDLTSLLGPAVAIGFIIGGMIMEGGHVDSILQMTAALIVFGGTFGSMMVAYPLPDMINAIKAAGTWLKNPEADPEQILETILDLAQTARKESITSLTMISGFCSMSMHSRSCAAVSTSRART